MVPPGTRVAHCRNGYILRAGDCGSAFFNLFLDAKAEEQSADNIEEIDCV